MKRLDIKVGFKCNNQCLFCVQGNKRKNTPQKNIKKIKEELKKNYRNGIKYVVFTGGEPTLHKDILEIIKYAKKIGYKQLQLQCNGRTLSNIKYVKKLANSGINEFGPSLHGFKSNTHNRLVQNTSARKQTIKGIKNIKKLGYRVITNTVITKQNYKELPKLSYLFIKLGVDQYQFAFPHILGKAWKNRKKTIPKKSESIPYIHQALDIGKKYGKTCMTEAIPFCFMEGYEWAIAEYNYMPDAKIIDNNYEIESYNKYKKNKGKKHGPPCKKCKLKNVCEGPWKEYPQIFGWDEFQSIKRDNT